eukprot:TRINITY_DN668_c0_g2_i2.p1 TRINITY_DN668_c0_g2~~TRINITY_DN668_c0_g2_i2.p1  ORF type:complete len:126 (-),score=51.75 TRINITY_DN668_c0_g2_i2:103-480(-)
MADKKLRVFKLREKSIDDLNKELEKHKDELAALRINKVAGGNAAKLAKIRVNRKAIAKYLTVVHQKRRNDIRSQLKNAQRLPLDLRPKLTRAIRQRLTKFERRQKTTRDLKREQNFPLRKYALRA